MTPFHLRVPLFDPYVISLWPPPVAKSVNRGAVSRWKPRSPVAGSPKKVKSTM